MRRWNSETGQSLIEFAMVLPMLLVVCVGMVELGRATWAWNMAQMAAAEGARRAIVIGGLVDANGNANTTAWKDTAVAGAHKILWGQDHETEQMLTGVTVTPTLDTAETPPLVTVNVAVPIKLLVFWGAKDSGVYTLHGRATMPVQPVFDGTP